MRQTGPNPQIFSQLALEYIFFVLLQLRKEVSGARGIFKTSEGTMKLHFKDFTPCSSFPLHYSFSQAEQNLNLKEGTRRETDSKFSGLLSKVWAESPCKVSGEETTEKWLLRQVNCFLKELFLWVPIVCYGGIMNKRMSSNAKKYCREVRTVRTHVKTGLKGSPQASGQNWRLTPPTAFNTVRAGEQTVEGIPGWRKGKNEWISEWVDGVEGRQRFVWGWVIRCEWTEGKVRSPQRGQGYPQSAEYCCISKKLGHRMTYQDLEFCGCKVFLFWLKIFRPLRKINSDPHLGF